MKKALITGVLVLVLLVCLIAGGDVVESTDRTTDNIKAAMQGDLNNITVEDCKQMHLTEEAFWWLVDYAEGESPLTDQLAFSVIDRHYVATDHVPEEDPLAELQVESDCEGFTCYEIPRLVEIDLAALTQAYRVSWDNLYLFANACYMTNPNDYKEGIPVALLETLKQELVTEVILTATDEQMQNLYQLVALGTEASYASSLTAWAPEITFDETLEEGVVVSYTKGYDVAAEVRISRVQGYLGTYTYEYSQIPVEDRDLDYDADYNVFYTADSNQLLTLMEAHKLDAENMDLLLSALDETETFLTLATDVAGLLGKTTSLTNIPLTDCKLLADIIWPLPGDYRTSDGFGPRDAPIPGASTFHKGVDIGGEAGAPIVAALAGTVVEAAFNESGGNHVYIDHGNGVVSRYLHCSQLLVATGDTVRQGEVIAYCGTTGVSTAPHLHFGIYIDGDAVDPMLFLSIPVEDQ